LDIEGKNPSHIRLGTITIVICSILLLGPASASQFAFADGNDSPEACKGSPTDGWGNSEMSNMYDAGVGNTIDEICIKDGNDSFGMSQHSGLITMDGTYGDGDVDDTCYSVSGLGMQIVTVTETGAAGCMGISHVDGVIDSDGKVGGHGDITSKTSLLVTGATLNASWMIPLLVSAVGIGIFVITYKKE